MKFNQTKKVYVIEQNPIFQFDIVEAIAMTLPNEISALLKKINLAVFSELLTVNPSLIKRFC